MTFPLLVTAACRAEELLVYDTMYLAIATGSIYNPPCERRLGQALVTMRKSRDRHALELMTTN